MGDVDKKEAAGGQADDFVDGFGLDLPEPEEKKRLRLPSWDALAKLWLLVGAVGALATIAIALRLAFQ